MTNDDKTVDMATPVGRVFKVTGAAGDRSVVTDIWNSGRYEPHLMKVMAKAIRPGAVCLDIGGNIGAMSLYLGHLVGDGRVYAFEPSSRNFAYLNANLAANGVGNVTTHRMAVADRPGELTLSFDVGDSGGAYLGKGDARRHSYETVPVTTVDDWVEAQGLTRVDAIKIDVEGAELQVLKGAAKTIARFRPEIFIEFNTLAMVRNFGQDPAAVFNFLKERYRTIGFPLLDGRLTRMRSARHLLDEVETYRGVGDLYCTQRWVLPTIVPYWRDALHYIRLKKKTLTALQGLKLMSYPDGTLTPKNPPRVVERGAKFTLPVELENASHYTYDSRGAHPVVLTYRWLAEDDRIHTWDGHRTKFQAPVGPGARTTMTATVEAPAAAGRYVLRLSLVQEQVAWAYELNARFSADVPIDVR